MQYAVGMQCAVITQCAVAVSAKRSTGTVELTNIGGGDQCKKVKAHTGGMQCLVGVSAKRSYGWWGPLRFSAKSKPPPMQWVCRMQLVSSTQ